MLDAGEPAARLQNTAHFGDDLFACNRIVPKAVQAPPFEMLATPTPLQQHTFDLLGLSPQV
jgi:hypothetical protein